MKENVRESNIISHSRGFMLRLKGVLTKDPYEKKRLLEASEKFFSKAVSVCPFSKVSLRNYADVVTLLDRRPLANHLYKRCLQLDSKDTNTLFKYGLFICFFF